MSDPDWHDVTATDRAGLNAVDAQIHDCPFVLADVEYDEASRTLIVPYRRYGWDQERQVGGTGIRVDYEFPWRRSYLRVLHAGGHRLVNDEDVDEAELLHVQYHARRGEVEVFCDVDTKVHVAVDRLEVAVEHTDEVLGFGRRSSWLGRVYRYDHAVRPQ